MKKTIVIILSLICCFQLFSQQVSGYMGKKFSVYAGYSFNPFLILDIASKGKFVDPPSKSYSQTSYYNNSWPDIASCYSVSVEYTIKEYTSINVKLASRPNIFVMENPYKPKYYYSMYDDRSASSAFRLRCFNINPAFYWYKASISPAPVGNFFSFGINYNLISLDSAKIVLSKFSNPSLVDMYNSNGKLRFADISFSTGRTFIIKNKCLIKFEFSVPYLIRALPNMFFFFEDDRSINFEDIYLGDEISRLIKRKISMNHLFNYSINIGIPL